MNADLVFVFSMIMFVYLFIYTVYIRTQSVLVFWFNSIHC